MPPHTPAPPFDSVEDAGWADLLSPVRRRLIASAGVAV
ncbi:MAG TPA: aromatic ring-cleaving dioxygenase, partial [Stenotrophomonas sp.]|nr:aromatic ring-cleaving dioxygenase [Stenotrophomonas sp.]